MTFNFIHVPKTAGTSFRKSLENKLGLEAIAYDYGRFVDETHDLIREGVYKGSVYDMRERLREFSLIAGHVPLTKYAPVTGVSRCIAFVREPVQRTYSDYLHNKKHFGYKGSIEEYLKRPAHRNRQSTHLGGVPLAAIGFIGLTERYTDSLALLGYQFPSLQVEELSLNTHRRNIKAEHKISDEDREIILAANDKDVALYDQAKQLFEQRFALYQNKKAVQRGVITRVLKHKIVGWLAGVEPGEVQAVHGEANEVAARARAVEYRPSLAGWGIERDGFVGFTLHNNEVDMHDCRVRIANTDVFLTGP
ncbi:sulfotransferase family 2 domain-containing protein [Gilvimarinus agarilyticus]|uniref:sulfotransferase family 2 domain-containing protein n=1 Tax=Gilvimarinus agarilyticus TaxID=679259 RepID=UPI00059F36BA|nr:sulfotransferase family 2 domain-containing protein [Gilvimarinus agarilyticus]